MTTTRPLQMVLRPHFWGSYEARWERATTHLMAPTPFRTVTLCGEVITDEDDDTNNERLDKIPAGAELPKGICKRCAKVVQKEEPRWHT